MKRLILSLFFILTFSLFVFSQSAEVIAEKANLRGAASQAGKVVTMLSCGARIKVIKQEGSWFLVESLEYVGWLHGNTIQFTSAYSTSPCFVPQTKRPRRAETRITSDAPSGAEATAKTGIIPTAICNDGTYSYSRHHSGTCSHHRGVYLWLDEPTRRAPASSGRSGGSQQTRMYIRGPRGGCYYINGNGNKTYVDRSMCN